METNNIVSRVQARKLNALIGESVRTTTSNVSETLDDLDSLLCGFDETIKAEGLGLDLVRQCRAALMFEASAAD